MSDLFQNVNGKLVPRDVCARKHGGNEQSKEAFEVVRNHQTSTQYACFFEIKTRASGATVDEVSEILGLTPNQISGRITELRIKGKIKKNGTRKTRSGCSAAVWVAV